MRNSIFQSVFLALLTTILSFTAAHSDPIRLACSSFPPFKIEDPEGKRQGIDVDVLNAAFKAVNRETDIAFYPWKRALRTVELGNSDALCGCSYLPEREENFIFSDVLGQHSQGVFLSAVTDLRKVDQISDLANHRVGAVRGYAVHKELLEQKINVSDATDDKQLLRMLLAGRVDAVYTYRDILLYNYSISGSSGNITYFETSSQPYYACVSRKAPGAEQIVEDLNRGLRIIRYDGSYQEIWDSYR